MCVCVIIKQTHIYNLFDTLIKYSLKAVTGHDPPYGNLMFPVSGHIPMNIPPSSSVFHLPIFRAIRLFFPTMFLDFNPIFVETAQFLSAKRKIVWLRTILRCAANELRTYRTPPERHSDVIICPKKDPSPLLYLSSKKAFTRSYFLYTNALR